MLPSRGSRGNIKCITYRRSSLQPVETKARAERRQATAAGLESVLGKHLRIDSQPGGMHLILRLQRRRSDRRLVARMREEGLYGEALTDWTIGSDGSSALPLSFTNIDSQRTAENLGSRILRLI
jgi:GntR family transcriptional regulator/MocR family aminotransferase